MPWLDRIGDGSGKRASFAENARGKAKGDVMQVGLRMDRLRISRRHQWFVGGEFVFEPKAVVWHKIPESRLTPRYFWIRCYAEGRSKWRVSALSGFGNATSNERSYVLRTLPHGIAKALAEALLRFDVGGPGAGHRDRGRLFKRAYRLHRGHGGRCPRGRAT